MTKLCGTQITQQQKRWQNFIEQVSSHLEVGQNLIPLWLDYFTGWQDFVMVPLANVYLYVKNLLNIASVHE